MITHRYIRLFYGFVIVTACCHGFTPSKCDVNQNGTTDVGDVQSVINQALGAAQANNDLNSDGVVNVIDFQIDLVASLGAPCIADPGLISIFPNTGQLGAANLTFLRRGLTLEQSGPFTTPLECR